MFDYYKPKKKCKIEDCIKVDRFNNLVSEINKDPKLISRQKELLTYLATKFIEIKYDKLADLYSTSDYYMQEWLEKLNCVIVDTDKAIANGYIKYQKDYNKLIRRLISPDDECQ